MKRITLPGVGHFTQHGLEPLLEFAAELRAGHQGAHVERDHPLVFQAFGHVGVDDSQGEPFGDCGFAHARLADQHGIVFRPPREHLHDAADFLVAADDRIELSLPRPLDQIDAVALQGLELALRRLIGHARAAADGLQHLEQLLVGDGVEFQDVLGLRIDLGQRQQQVFGRDELVFHRVGFALGGFEHLVEFSAESAAGPRPTRGRNVPVRPARSCPSCPPVDADAIEDRPHDAVIFRKQRCQQVQRVDLGMAAIRRKFLCPGHGFLGFEREFVETKCHHNTSLIGMVFGGLIGYWFYLACHIARSRSYSSWLPIQNQKNVSPSSRAIARNPPPIRIDQTWPTFLKQREGCLGFFFHTR